MSAREQVREAAVRLAGRVFAGSPASINLGIPPHAFETETLLVIGVDPAATVQGAA